VGRSQECRSAAGEASRARDTCAAAPKTGAHLASGWAGTMQGGRAAPPSPLAARLLPGGARSSSPADGRAPMVAVEVQGASCNSMVMDADYHALAEGGSVHGSSTRSIIRSAGSARPSSLAGEATFKQDAAPCCSAPRCSGDARHAPGRRCGACPALTRSARARRRSPQARRRPRDAARPPAPPRLPRRPGNRTFRGATSEQAPARRPGRARAAGRSPGLRCRHFQPPRQLFLRPRRSPRAQPASPQDEVLRRDPHQHA